MESYSYYKLKNEHRISKIKSDLEKSRTPELIKEFVGKEDETLNIVIKNIIEINDVSNINKEVIKWKISIHPMYIDLIKEFYELNESAVNNIDKEWISSFKSLANKILWEIRLNKNKSKNYEFHLNQSLLIGIQL
jgi:DNA primase large subunit